MLAWLLMTRMIAVSDWTAKSATLAQLQMMMTVKMFVHTMQDGLQLQLQQMMTVIFELYHCVTCSAFTVMLQEAEMSDRSTDSALQKLLQMTVMKQMDHSSDSALHEVLLQMTGIAEFSQGFDRRWTVQKT